MEVSKNYSPSFSGIQIKSSTMNKVQQNLSRTVSDMLDYADEYIKVADDVDLYFLPGKSKNSVTVRFVDRFSDMFFRKDDRVPLQVSVNKKMNLDNFVEVLKTKLANIGNGKYAAPEYDEVKFLNGTTDVAKMKPDVYEEAFENMEEVEALMGKDAAKQYALEEYNHFKRIYKDDPEF